MRQLRGRGAGILGDHLLQDALDLVGMAHAALDVSSEATAAAYCGSPTDATGSGETYVVVDLVADVSIRPNIHRVGEGDSSSA